MTQPSPKLRYFLSLFIILLPLLSALPELASFQTRHSLGMGTPAPLSLDTAAKRLNLAPSNNVKEGYGSFEIALTSFSALTWNLLGRFLLRSRAPGTEKLLLKIGRLQLEGG